MGNLPHQIMLAIINFNTSCSSVLVYCTDSSTCSRPGQARPGGIFSLLKFICVGESHGRPRVDAATL